MMRRAIVLCCVLSVCAAVFGQEALKSISEDYYDFLVLTDQATRPTLGYRTLSDSKWTVTDADHLWAANKLGTRYTLWQASSEAQNWITRGIHRDVTLRAYGPEWYNSYNTAAPYGQNDGAFWQGKGYNTSITGGIRLEALGFELTLKPQFSFTQNKSFGYTAPNATYTGATYTDKADTYGYYGVPSVDAPQRFGDSSFQTFDWGDTEIRYSWHNLTVGFGTESIWLGPAQLNPILHSNNAASYPKIDVGLRKTKLTMPHFGWHLGYLEARGWWGKLSESDYFDTNDENDNNLITGLGVYYQLPFLKDFTVGLNRTMLSKWDDMTRYTLLNVYVPTLSSGSSGGDDESDQRLSVTFDYHNHRAGLELYLEWARNDFSPNDDFYVRYPFHTAGWTFGTRKSVNLPFSMKGMLHLELTFLECSADYDRLINWYTTFYSHHAIAQGYTNRGQWLGAGIGTGGNSQYLGFTAYHKKGSVTIFGQRRNPDLDYTMFIDSRNWPRAGAATTTEEEKKHNAEKNIRALLDVGLRAVYFVTPNVRLNGSFVFENEHNPHNLSKDSYSRHRYNCAFSLGAAYLF